MFHESWYIDSPDVREILICEVDGGFQGKKGDVVFELTTGQSVEEPGVRYPLCPWFESNRLSVVQNIVLSWEIFKNIFPFQDGYLCLTKHHSDVIPQYVNFPRVRELLQTMTRSEDMSVGDQRTSASAGLLRLRGSQEQQSRPWKLICLRFFSANTVELIMNILSSLHFTFWPINVTQKRKRIETMPMVKHKKNRLQ